jgi:hypothetical protein
MTPIHSEQDEARNISRRRLAQVAITALSVAGFGGAALTGVMSARPDALARGSDDSRGSGGSGGGGSTCRRRCRRNGNTRRECRRRCNGGGSGSGSGGR